MYSAKELMTARSVKKEGEKFSPQEEILIQSLANSIRTGLAKKTTKKIIEDACRILGHSFTAIRIEAHHRAHTMTKEVSISERVENSTFKAKLTLTRTIDSVKKLFN